MGRTKPETATVRVPIELLETMDTWIAQQPDPKPSRPEAIRVALREWLAGMGVSGR